MKHFCRSLESKRYQPLQITDRLAVGSLLAGSYCQKESTMIACMRGLETYRFSQMNKKTYVSSRSPA